MQFMELLMSVEYEYVLIIIHLFLQWAESFVFLKSYSF